MTFSDGSADRPVRRADGEPEVPGVSLRSRPRDAGAGELWAGQFDQSGVECVVRRVRLAPDPVLRSAAVSAARALAELDHPHLVPVLTALPTAEGLAVITRPVVGAISLARLLAVRGALDPGEVVTVGLPIAQALAAVHAAGVVHGRLESEDILLEATGRPVLAGVGVAALADAARPDPVPPGAAAADVRDLATLLLAAMREATGPDAAAVAVAVATALVDDPHRRPSAGDLAATLARSAIPLPVRLVTPDQSDPADERDLSGWPGEGPAEPPAPMPPAPPRRAADRRPGPPDQSGRDGAGGGRAPGGVGEAVDDGRPRLLAGARLDPGPDDDADDDAHGVPGGRPPQGRPGRGATGATAVDAAELLGSLPPPPKRSTPGRRSGRTAGRGDTSASGRSATRPAGGGGRADPHQGAAGDRASRGSPTAPGAARPGPGPGPGSPSPSGASALAATGGGASTAGRTAPGGRSGRVGGGGRSQRPGARRYRWLLPVTAGIGLFAVVVAAVLLMTSPSGRDADEAASTPPGSTVPTPGAANRDPTASPVANQSPEQIWRGVLGALNTARSRAFEQAKESLLAESDAPGSPAYNADVALMRQVVSLGAHSSPLRTVVDALEVRTDTADRTVLRVTDRLDAYDYFDAAGRVVAHKDAKAPQRRDLVLVRTASGWRVSDTVPITAG